MLQPWCVFSFSLFSFFSFADRSLLSHVHDLLLLSFLPRVAFATCRPCRVAPSLHLAPFVMCRVTLSSHVKPSSRVAPRHGLPLLCRVLSHHVLPLITCRVAIALPCALLYCAHPCRASLLPRSRLRMSLNCLRSAVGMEGLV